MFVFVCGVDIQCVDVCMYCTTLSLHKVLSTIYHAHAHAHHVTVVVTPYRTVSPVCVCMYVCCVFSTGNRRCVVRQPNGRSLTPAVFSDGGGGGGGSGEGGGGGDGGGRITIKIIMLVVVVMLLVTSVLF